MTDEPNTSSPVPSGHVAAEDGPPLPQIEFDEHGPIDGEPDTDVLIKTDGADLRERMVEVATNSDTTLSAVAAPVAYSIAISNALLDDDGNVATDEEGRPKIASMHELVLTNEAMDRLGEAGLEKAVLEARQIAAAKATAEFRGADLYQRLLASRTRKRDKAAD